MTKIDPTKSNDLVSLDTGDTIMPTNLQSGHAGVCEAVCSVLPEAVSVFTVDRRGTEPSFVLEWNNTIHSDQTGVTTESHGGQTLETFLSAVDAEAVIDSLQECLNRGEPIERKETLSWPSSSVSWHTTYRPVVEDGTIDRIVAISRSGPETKPSDGQQSTNEFDRQQLYETVIENTSEGLFVVNRDEEIEYANPTVVSASRSSLSALEGTDLSESISQFVSHSDTERLLSIVESALYIDDQGHTADDEITFPRTIDIQLALPEETVDAELSVSPLRADGTVIGAVITSRDISERKRRDKEVQELKERLELAVEGAGIGVWDWDMTTDRVEYNEQWAAMLGYSLEDIRPHLSAWETRTHPDDIGRIETALENHKQRNTEYYDTEHRMKTADGNWKWIRDVGKVVEWDSDGEPLRAVGIHIDIDERKTTQQTLATERDMFAQGPVVVFKWRNESGRPIEYVSDNVSDVFGYSPDELTSRTTPSTELIHEADRERVRREIDEYSTAETAYFSHEPYRIWSADGEARWVLDHTRNVCDDGEVTHRIGYLIDITHQRETEISLRKAQEVGNMGWWRKDILSDQIYWSDRIYAMWDVDSTSGTIDHKTFLEYIHPADRDVVDNQWEAAKAGEPYDIEHRIITDEGETRWMRQKAEIEFNDAGKAISAIGIVQDITDRKEREQQLQTYQEELVMANEHLQQFAKAVEQSAHAVYITDTDGQIEYVNPAFESITGHAVPDVLGQTPKLLQSGEHSNEYYEELWSTILSGEQWENEVINLRADGERLVLNQTISPITDDDGVPQNFVAVAHDITERKQYEEALEQAQNELRKIIDLIPDPIFVKNQDDEVLLTNEAYASLIDATPAEIESGSQHHFGTHIENYDEIKQRDMDVIETTESTQHREELRLANGETYVFETERIPFEAAETDEQAVLGYARDITDLTAYETRLETQRDNLDILNQVVRHDIRNDLQLISAYAEMLEEDLENEQHQYISKVMSSTRNAINLTTTARDLAETMLQVDTEHQPVSLETTIKKQIDRLKEGHEDTDIRITSSVPAVTVIGDELLDAVFRNLLSNAVQHNDKDVPEIAISGTIEDDYVLVQIADNGPGVSDAHKTEIFGRGNQGLESAGTGIGLYLVDTLVDSYGGDVWVEDNDPEGAVFVVKLCQQPK